jgi:hypothetical protein
MNIHPVAVPTRSQAAAPPVAADPAAPSFKTVLDSRRARLDERLAERGGRAEPAGYSGFGRVQSQDPHRSDPLMDQAPPPAGAPVVAGTGDGASRQSPGPASPVHEGPERPVQYPDAPTIGASEASLAIRTQSAFRAFAMDELGVFGRQASVTARAVAVGRAVAGDGGARGEVSSPPSETRPLAMGDARPAFGGPTSPETVSQTSVTGPTVDIPVDVHPGAAAVLTSSPSMRLAEAARSAVGESDPAIREGGAPMRRGPQDTQSGTPVNLIVTGADGAVEVLAVAPDLGAPERARLQEALEAVVREFGGAVAGLSLNGQSLSSTAAGATHGGFRG